MDFDEQKLPEDIQHLLQRLRGHLEPGEAAVTSTSFARAQNDFVQYIVRYVQKEARRRILEATGNCSSIIRFNEVDFEYFQLTEAEWEMMLTALLFNSSLEYVSLTPTRFEDSLLIRGKLWGKFFMSSPNVKKVRLEFDSTESESRRSYLPDIVSGLRENPNPPLEDLTIASIGAKDLIHVAEVIQCATNLRSFFFEEDDSLSSEEGVIETLAESLIHASHLNNLTISYHNGIEGVADLLVKCFAGDSRFQTLAFQHGESRVLLKFWGSLHSLMSSNGSEIKVTISRSGLNLRDEPFLRVIQNLIESADSTMITIGTPLERYLKANGDDLPPPLNSLTINYVEEPEKDLHSGLINLFGFLESGKRKFYVRVKYDVEKVIMYDKYFASLTFYLRENVVNELTLVLSHPRYPRLENLQSNSSIIKLTISQVHPTSNSWWISLFESLRANKSIKCLDLTGCYMTATDFKTMMALLRVNLTLEIVELQGTPWVDDGKAALILEALARNKNQASYFSIMNAAGFEFDQAKVGRIFLCGSPYAGKTRLKLTMMKTYHKKSRSESKPGQILDGIRERLRTLELWRTKGVEVELLKDDQEGQVFIWDLAGQYMFRALQDLIFPRTNQSCLFVFLFNPFHENTRNLKEKVYDTFRMELEEWLRFIVSNCQITGEHLPQVVVVVTHKDWIQNHGDKNSNFELTLIQRMMSRVQSKFQGVADVRCDVVYHVGGMSKREVKPFTKFILESIDKLLRGHVVPTVCSQLSSSLISRAKSTISSPVWTISAFYKFCREDQKALDAVSSEVLHAVLLYMHDVGSVIIVRNRNSNDEPWVVVDPNWLTENFLGEIICRGHHFDVQGGSSTPKWEDSVYSDGFVDEPYFQHLLSMLLRSRHNEHKRIEESTLEDIMHGLDLCYKIQEDGCEKYFVPILYSGLGKKCDTRTRPGPHWDEVHEEGCQYLGYRLQCEDNERTSLSTAFFQRYQINSRRRLIQQLRINDSCIKCHLGFMKIKYDGYEIILESEENTGQHVDILVKSSQLGVPVPREKSQIIKFVKSHVLRDLQAFCATPKGCPGINLVVSIIRTRSVIDLIPIQQRKGAEHCVKLETLKQDFQKFLERNLEDVVEEDVDPESLLNFQHSWPNTGTEIVRNVLDHGDVTDVLQRIQMDMKDNDFRTELNQLRGILRRLGEVSGSTGTEHGSTLISSREETTIPILSGEASSSSMHNISDGDVTGEANGASMHKFTDGEVNLSEGERFLAHNIEVVAAKVDNLAVKVDNLASYIRTGFQQLANHVKDVKSDLRDMQSTMTAVSSNIDKMIGYSLSREDHSSPRRPFFTRTDAGIGDKIKSFVLLGQAVSLHFMCEARNRPHVVEDQDGLSLIITKEEMDWVPYISTISLKMISLMLEVGIQLTAGLGSVVPDLSNLVTGKTIPLSNELLEHLNREGNTSIVDPKDPHVQMAWCSLQAYLAKELDGQYGTSFLLHRVRYRSSSDPYAWLCQSCVERGIRQKLLDVCSP